MVQYRISGIYQGQIRSKILVAAERRWNIKSSVWIQVKENLNLKAVSNFSKITSFRKGLSQTKKINVAVIYSQTKKEDKFLCWAAVQVKCLRVLKLLQKHFFLRCWLQVSSKWLTLPGKDWQLLLPFTQLEIYTRYQNWNICLTFVLFTVRPRFKVKGCPDVAFPPSDVHPP